MSDISHFESREGTASSTADKVFAFITDLRNFERFIPAGTISEWKADKESCSLVVSLLGTVKVKIKEKGKDRMVIYKGDAPGKNGFEAGVSISGNDNNTSDVKIYLSADLNPMLKMIAAKPVNAFLEMLINEMEKFRGWEETRE